MTDKNIIKVKNVHVQELFYLEIINGFNTLEKSLTVKNVIDTKKGPVVMPSAQASKFKRLVLPLILKSVLQKGLLLDFYRGVVQGTKDSYILKLRKSLFEADTEIDELVLTLLELLELVELQKNKGLLGKIRKIVETYNKIARTIAIIRNVRDFYKEYQERIQYNYLALQDPDKRKDIKDRLLQQVVGGLKYLKPVLLKVLLPTFMELGSAIDEKVDLIISAFWWWIGKRVLFPDFSDPIDVCLWVYGWGSTIAGAIITAASLGTASTAGAAMVAAGWGARFANLARIIGRISNSVRKVSKTFDNMSHLRTGLFLLNSGRNIRAIRRGYKNAKLLYSLGESLYTGIDILDFDADDRAELLRRTRERTSQWGLRVTLSIQRSLGNKLTSLEDITEDVYRIGEDFVNTTRRLSFHTGWVGVYLRKYNCRISITGLYDIEYMRTFSQVGNAFKSLHKRLNDEALKHRGFTLNDVAIKSGNKITIETDSYTYLTDKYKLQLRTNGTYELLWWPKDGLLIHDLIEGANARANSSSLVFVKNQLGSTIKRTRQNEGGTITDEQHVATPYNKEYFEDISTTIHYSNGLPAAFTTKFVFLPNFTKTILHTSDGVRIEKLKPDNPFMGIFAQAVAEGTRVKINSATDVKESSFIVTVNGKKLSGGDNLVAGRYVSVTGVRLTEISRFVTEGQLTSEVIKEQHLKDGTLYYEFNKLQLMRDLNNIGIHIPLSLSSTEKRMQSRLSVEKETTSFLELLKDAIVVLTELKFLTN